MNDYDENRIWSRASPELRDKNHLVTFNNRQRRLTWCFCNVSTHTEYQGYRYYRNRGSNEHNVNQGLDQSVNYFAKTAVKALNNAIKRSNVVAFYNKSASIIVQTHEKKLYLNGNKITKQKLNALIPSLLMRLPLSSSQEEFVKFIDTIVQTDPVISNAIINKIEYKFWHYKDNREIVTLLNVEKTGKEHSAIELYEGVWVDFKDTQMKSFINSCRGNKNKFLGVSPEELYYLSRKEFLKRGQVQVVYAFLEQNRKASLVLQRSMELFENLTTRFKGRIYEKDFYLEGNTDPETEQHIKFQSMAVKGKQLDWIVVDRGYKQGRQDVSTYAVMPIENWDMTICEEFGKISLSSKTKESGLVRYPYLREWMLDSNNKKYVFIGPICIDQANTNVSLGDQFASRAMALLNDIHSFEQVSTLRQFAQYKPEIRVEWDELSAMQTRSCA